MMKLIEKIKRRWRYRTTWGTPLGQDCINLDASLCEWLGPRLIFLSEHGNFAGDVFKGKLKMYGEDLLKYPCGLGNDLTMDEQRERVEKAKKALAWVSRNLNSLWD